MIIYLASLSLLICLILFSLLLCSYWNFTKRDSQRSYSEKQPFTDVFKINVFEIFQNFQKTTNTGVSLQYCRPPAWIFIKKETPPQVFFCDFCKIFQNTFFIEHLWGSTSGSSGRYLIMTPIEAIVTLMPTLNILYSVAITLKPSSTITSQNLENF